MTVLEKLDINRYDSSIKAVRFIWDLTGISQRVPIGATTTLRGKRRGPTVLPYFASDGSGIFIGKFGFSVSSLAFDLFRVSFFDQICGPGIRARVNPLQQVWLSG